MGIVAAAPGPPQTASPESSEPHIPNCLGSNNFPAPAMVSVHPTYHHFRQVAAQAPPLHRLPMSVLITEGAAVWSMGRRPAAHKTVAAAPGPPQAASRESSEPHIPDCLGSNIFMPGFFRLLSAESFPTDGGPGAAATAFTNLSLINR